MIPFFCRVIGIIDGCPFSRSVILELIKCVLKASSWNFTLFTVTQKIDFCGASFLIVCTMLLVKTLYYGSGSFC